MQKKIIRNTIAFSSAVVMLLLSACGGGSSSNYDKYYAAYSRVGANGCMDADLTVNLEMDDSTKSVTGNFKLDNRDENKTILYLELTMDGKTTTQFSDGEYLYTDAQNRKMKYKLGEKIERTKEDTAEDPANAAAAQAPAEAENAEGTAPTAPDPNGAPDPNNAPDPNSAPPSADTSAAEGTEAQSGGDAAPTFDASSFLSEFASFLDAGKIKDMGLLTPLSKLVVSETTVNGNVYSLDVNESIVSTYLDSLKSSIMADPDKLEIEKLDNFAYETTIEGDYVTNVKYAGDLVVNIDSSISPTGEDVTYTLKLEILVKFNNPGGEVDITLPSTEDYKDLSSN